MRMPSSGGGNGIAGSGIFGMFGTTVRCNSEDESMYCSFMKMINVLFMLFFLSYIFYIAYTVVSPILFKGFKSSKR